jgi:hypothetical protein
MPSVPALKDSRVSHDVGASLTPVIRRVAPVILGRAVNAVYDAKIGQTVVRRAKILEGYHERIGQQYVVVAAQIVAHIDTFALGPSAQVPQEGIQSPLGTIGYGDAEAHGMGT